MWNFFGSVKHEDQDGLFQEKSCQFHHIFVHSSATWPCPQWEKLHLICSQIRRNIAFVQTTLTTHPGDRMWSKNPLQQLGSLSKHSPGQSDCISDLPLRWPRWRRDGPACDSVSPGSLWFQRRVIKPTWFCIPRVYSDFRWRQKCCKPVGYYAAANGTKAAAIREGLQETVWRTARSRAAPSASKLTATESVRCGHTKGAFVLARLQLVAQTRQHHDDISWGWNFNHYMRKNKPWGNRIHTFPAVFAHAVVVLVFWSLRAHFKSSHLSMCQPFPFDPSPLHFPRFLRTKFLSTKKASSPTGHPHEMIRHVNANLWHEPGETEQTCLSHQLTFLILHP